MKPNTSEIFVLIDESGSMAGLGDETRKSVTKFIEEQKAVPGDAYISLAKFSTESTIFREGDLKTIDSEVTIAQYSPETGGYTALADAIVRYVSQVGEKLKALPEDERPENVIFVIVTDGAENASQTYTIADAKAKIKHQTDKYNWKFVYLASGLEAVSQGYSLGFNPNSIGSYTSSAKGINAAVYVASSSVTRGRLGQSTNLSDEEQNLLAQSA